MATIRERISGIAIVLAALALVAGCSSAPQSSKTAHSSSNNAQRSNGRLKAAYIKFVRNDVPELAGGDSSTLLDLGHSMCDSVQVGNKKSTLQVLKMLIDQGIGARHAGALMAYAGLLCPDKRSALSIL